MRNTQKGGELFEGGRKKRRNRAGRSESQEYSSRAD